MVNSPGLRACEIAYTRSGPWLEEFLVLLGENYACLKAYFARHIPQVKVYPLEGTYLVWLDFRALGLSPEALEQFMINEAEWFTDEGHIFGEEGRGFERINLACPRSVLEEAMERLRGALAARKLL
jgi:bifunctional pyridoxal-dependent enzyme with beta-cystathionase and maltose regulon repressor activities